MSHEALHKTKVELEDQKRSMSEIDKAISGLQEERNKEQKILNSKTKEKADLETKITKNEQDQKKDITKAELDKLIDEKNELEIKLTEAKKDVTIYSDIVKGYNKNIEILKKSKDTIKPKLESAKKESIGEKIAHFTKNNWRALLASTILLGTAATAYEYGKSSTKEKAPTEETPKKGTENKVIDSSKATSSNINIDNNNTIANYNTGVEKKNKKHEKGKGGEDKKPVVETVNTKVVYELWNTSHTEKKDFKTREERKKFADEHGLIMHEE